MAGLSMSGHIDGVFQSVDATFTPISTGYTDTGLPSPTSGTPTPFTVNVQPLNLRELDILTRGNVRIVDGRKIYVNDGDLTMIEDNGVWEFLGQKWKTVQSDNRYWNNYCKVIVSRIDPQ